MSREKKDDRIKPLTETEGGEEPEIYAVSKQKKGGYRTSRRDFLLKVGAGSAMAATLGTVGCGGGGGDNTSSGATTADGTDSSGTGSSATTKTVKAEYEDRKNHSGSCACDTVCTCDKVCVCDTTSSGSGETKTCTCDGVCTCDDVCACVGHTVSNTSSDSGTSCSCDSVCTCDADSSHYWYPN